MLDPYLIKDIIAIEKFRDEQLVGRHQTMTGEMVLYSITSTLPDLKWPTLAQCRQISRLGAFYQSMHQLIALRIPPHFNRTNRFTRHHHPLHFITPH